MKAKDIIKCIRETTDEKSLELIKNIFVYAYLKGINRGYDNALKLSKQHVILSDTQQAELEFNTRYA